MDKVQEIVAISNFTESYKGYPALFYPENKSEPMPKTDLIEYDENDKYNINLKPRNKQAHLPYLQDIGNICVCQGRVLNDSLSEYYVVTVFDGYPYQMILVHEDDLIYPENEI